MSSRRNGKKKRCVDCWVNRDFCYCNSIRPLKSQHHVTIIRHGREKFLTSNTAQLAKLSFNLNFEIIERDENGELGDFLRPGFTPIIIFPDKECIMLDYQKRFENIPHDFGGGPFQLLVIDGTWSQAKKMQRRIKGLKNIPKVGIKNTPKSRYQLRHQHIDIGLCTFEAILYGLDYFNPSANLVKDGLFNLDEMNFAHLFARNYICPIGNV